MNLSKNENQKQNKKQIQTKLFPSSMLQLRLVLTFCEIKSTSHSIIENS
jgi:hypothetical protein